MKTDTTTGVIAGAEPDLDAHIEAVGEDIQARAETTTPDPDAGIKHLRTTDSGAMRIWTVKGPKETGGTISAVFMQDASKVVMLHQLASGKFAVYEKVS